MAISCAPRPAQAEGVAPRGVRSVVGRRGINRYTTMWCGSSLAS